MGKFLSWTAIVLNGLWVILGGVFLIAVILREPGTKHDIAYQIGYAIAIFIAGLLIVGVPIFSILALIFGARLREPKAPAADAVFQ